MIEFRPNKLDLEYMQLSAEYILEENPQNIMPRLENLAKQGQINAIQLWYNFNKIGASSEIDSIVENLIRTKSQNLNSASYNELYAMGKYNEQLGCQKEEGKKLIAQWKSLIEKCENNYTIGYHGARHYGDNSAFEKEINEIKEEKIPATAPHLNYYYKATFKAFSHGYNTQNPFVLLKALQMSTNLFNTPYISTKNCNKALKELYKDYVKQYKKMKKEAPSISPKSNPQFFYHFAKTALMYDKIDTKTRSFVVKALTEIANLEPTITKSNNLQETKPLNIK